MSNEKHTPGPWRWVKLHGGGARKLMGRGNVPFAEEYVSLAGNNMSVSTANLIAAAPDLLEALKELTKIFDHEKQSMYGFASKQIEAANAAISKAERGA